LISFLFNDLIN